MTKRSLGYPAGENHSYATIETRAQSARRTLCPGMPLYKQINGIHLFDGISKLKPEDSGRTIKVISGVEEVLYAEGSSAYNREYDEIEVTLPESVYKQLEGEHSRAKFTLCHEIGHVCLHVNVLIQLSKIPHHIAAMFRGENAKHPIYRDTEWQADSFAGALLMPIQGIAYLLESFRFDTSALQSREFIFRVSEQFGVSYKAAQTRLSIVASRWNEIMKYACSRRMQ